MRSGVIDGGNDNTYGTVLQDAGAAMEWSVGGQLLVDCGKLLLVNTRARGVDVVTEATTSPAEACGERRVGGTMRSGY